MPALWVAEREYLIAGTQDSIVARISQPVRAESGEWSCVIKVSGSVATHESTAYGEDSLQALMMGLSKLRIVLATRPAWAALTWLGETDLGIDLVPP